MPDIETLVVRTTNYETIGRELTPDNNPGKRQRNCQSKRAVQTEGGKPETCKNKRQDIKKQCHADNTHEPSVTPNPSVIGKNINEKSFLPEPINNDNKSSFQN